MVANPRMERATSHSELLGQFYAQKRVSQGPIRRFYPKTLYRLGLRIVHCRFLTDRNRLRSADRRFDRPPIGTDLGVDMSRRIEKSPWDIDANKKSKVPP
jgi:hypothetical protein